MRYDTAVFTRARLTFRRFKLRLSRRSRLLRVILVGYLLLLGVGSFMGNRGLWASYQLWREIRQEERATAELQKEAGTLQQEIELYRHDRKTIEKFAREQLRLAGPNEIHYIFR